MSVIGIVLIVLASIFVAGIVSLMAAYIGAGIAISALSKHQKENDDGA